MGDQESAGGALQAKRKREVTRAMSSTATDSADLSELSDPEFFVRWAKVRLRYAVEHTASKQDYDDVLAEYRRRLDGG